MGLLAGLLLAGGCQKDYLDINNNPNSPVYSTPDLTLAAALNQAAAGFGLAGDQTIRTDGTFEAQEIGGFFAGQITASGSVSGFVGERTYNYDTGFRTNVWSGIYNNLADFDDVEKSATTLKYTTYTAIAKIMKAYNYQILVDAYGNVPYSEALQGTTVIRPKYESGQAIYDDLLKRIDSGIADAKVAVSGTNPSPGSADIFFKGDMAKWVRFANTLKLRMLIRQTNVAGKDLKGEIAKIVAEGSGFLKAGENVTANPGYTGSEGKTNPFWGYYGFKASGAVAANKDFYALTDFAIKLLQGTNDPRLPLIAAPAASDRTFRGVPYGGGNDAFLASKVSGFGPGILKSFDQPTIVMTAAESFFLQAEAAQRGLLTGGDAKALYESGVRESFKQFGGAAADATAYLGGNGDFTAATDKIQAIITQKWIATIGNNGFEAWSEYRRTGFPKIPLSVRAIGTKQPVRLLYPRSEYGTNAENVAAQGTVSQFDTKIFWMK